MKKDLNLEKCKSSNKGITLIALVITIIVLLILAGVTIAQLTGSDSAPAKANEAKQKNDIGAMKDEISIFAQNKQMEAYDDVYVGNAATAGGAQATVGSRVITALRDYDGVTKNGVTISLDESNANYAEITLATTDWKQTGRITKQGGVLTWQDIGANTGTSGGNGGGGQQATLPENAVQTLAQAGTIQRWDKINYNPGTATTASIDLPEGASIEGTKLASLSLPEGASIESGTISASDASNWVVLDVDTTTGEVLIMPTTVSSTTLTLSGKDGYNNAIEALNTVAGIYLNPAYAASARSLTVEDVNKAESHTPNGNVAGPYTWNHRYGVDLEDEESNTFLNIIDYGEGHENEERSYESTATTGSYIYLTRNFTSLGSCWLASRNLYVGTDICYFSVHWLYDGVVDGGPVAGNYLFNVNSDGDTNDNYYSFPVVPVVSLKSNIQLTQGTGGTETVEVGTSGNDEHTTFDREYNAWTIKE